MGKGKIASQDEHWYMYHAEVLARASEAARGWSRVVQQPHKRSWHVLVSVCAACGNQHASLPGAMPVVTLSSIVALRLTTMHTGKLLCLAKNWMSILGSTTLGGHVVDLSGCCLNVGSGGPCIP